MFHKKESLVTNISMLNFIFTLIPTIIILVIICFFVCKEYKNAKINEVSQYLQECAQSVSNDIDESIQKTDYITRNINIVDNLDTKFTNRYELMKFINSINIFMDAMESDDRSNLEQMMIYTSNLTLYESKYLRNISNLNNWQTIISKMDVENSRFLWNYELELDNYGQQYFVFYLRVPMQVECIIEGRIPFKKEFKKINDLEISLKKYEHSGKNIIYQNNQISIVEPVINNYCLEGSLPYKILYRQYINYILILVLLIFLCMVIIYFISKMSVNKITFSITSLIGDLQQNVDPLLSGEEYDSNYLEIKVIKEKINELVMKVRSLSDFQHQNEMLQKSLELEVLSSKLNPHLLYNSLASINLVAFKNDYAKIREITDVMVDYYRMVLNNGKQIVTVEEELRLIEKFIKINEISRNKKITLEIDVDERIHEYNILHLLFQPIVENAILHGLNRCKIGAVIKIKAVEINNYLDFEISDNGCGMDSGILDMLNNHKNTGYGINNTRMRIQFYYGDKCGIQFRSIIGEGTTVMIRTKSTLNM